MPTSFQEFLRQKAERSDWKDRSRSRGEWLGALNGLFDQLRDWLRESDPDGLVEVVPYEVERVEERLGIYDAPALKVRLGTDAADILPVGRYATQHVMVQTLQAIPENKWRWGDLSGGRVDITDGERKYQLLRSVEGGQNRWFVWDGKPPLNPLDRGQLETILQDLLR
jgi:hypothetical protein